MKAAVTVVVIWLGLMTSAVQAQETADKEALENDWAFGFQAIPGVVGLSLRRQFNDVWQVQGVVQPTGDELGFGLRVLRGAVRKQFWQSYLFGGIAGRNESDTGFEPDTDFDTTDIALTVGLGVEWAWTAKNTDLPPLAWSLELGLGFSSERFDDPLLEDDSDTFLAFGFGIHYFFDLR